MFKLYKSTYIPMYPSQVLLWTVSLFFLQLVIKLRKVAKQLLLVKVSV